MQKDTGFTILELAVVVAMAAILTAIAIPYTISWLNNSKLNGDVFNLRGDLEMAKLRAIKENANVAVLFNANGYEIFIDNGDGGGVAENWVRDGGELIVINRQLSGGVTIDLASTTFNNNRTRFDQRGLLDSTINPNLIETVVIESSAGTKNVEVLQVGRIRVQ